MTIKLLLQLIFGVFSFKRKNMRGFNPRRILMSFILLPVFTIQLLLNNLFLLLDYVFFPAFLNQKIKSPVFIIAAPRSATTYLFHTLAASDHYTYFKLWEIVFAPSICQKYIALIVLKLDRFIGSPLKKIILFTENQLIGKLKKIHLIGLNLPEEDEAVLLWSLSSFYLNFFYPDSSFFDDLVLFDQRISETRKTRIMKSYERYVKRHNFVFNKKNEKHYLSKNPLMMAKVKSLAFIYPDAVILNINRSPSKTLPSTLELNAKLYSLFTSVSVSKELNEKSTRIVIEWYKMAERYLNEYYPNNHLKIDFLKLTKHNEDEEARISAFLNLPPSVFKKEVEKDTHHKSENNYKELDSKQLKLVLQEIPFMADYS
jgi:omega-hydroxy-beta-dihydromenaquinone-9 sulfotransferase